MIKSRSIVCISGSLPGGFSPDVPQLISSVTCNRKGRLIADVAGEPMLCLLRASPYLVKLNGSEARKTVEITGRDASDVKTLLDTITSIGAQNVIITEGRAGWVASVAGQYLKCTIEPNPNGFDIGAGDAMMAALVCGLKRGDSWNDVLEFATRVAAASTYCQSAGEIVFDQIHTTPPCRIETL